jgi:hypothetical protein
MILDSMLKSLEVKLSGAVATTELPWTASYIDIDQTTFAATTAAESDGTTNGGTAVTMVAAPSAGQSRQIKSLSVVNKDTVAATVTIQINNNGTKRIMFEGQISVGDNIEYVG